MISFLDGNLLKKELCCKFMLKHDIKKYFQLRNFRHMFPMKHNTHRLGNV